MCEMREISAEGGSDKTSFLNPKGQIEKRKINPGVRTWIIFILSDTARPCGM